MGFGRVREALTTVWPSSTSRRMTSPSMGEVMTVSVRFCSARSSVARAWSRVEMAELLLAIEERIPNVRRVMFAALSNVRASHLLDRELADLWATRPTELRPDPAPKGRPAHARALPVLMSDG